MKSIGNLSFCPVMPDEKYIIGNILNQMLNSLWQDPKWEDIRHSTIDAISGCVECGSQSQCLGGCSCKSKAYNHYEQFTSTAPWACSQFKNNTIFSTKPSTTVSG
ncbi:SPASM domain-containing protein [Lonsdalea populi]|nr:SPASM domain-containing protein [Lonsdalea populi]